MTEDVSIYPTESKDVVNIDEYSKVTKSCYKKLQVLCMAVIRYAGRKVAQCSIIRQPYHADVDHSTKFPILDLSGYAQSRIADESCVRSAGNLERS